MVADYRRQMRTVTTEQAPVVRRVTKPRTVLAVASLGGFLAFLDATIVNVAIPSIVEDFEGATLDGVSWVLNAYNIVFAAFLVASGRLADLLGRKRVFEVGVILFTAASVMCAVSPTLGLLVFSRVLQALGAAIIVPSSLALVMAAFTGADQARGIALWSAGAALAAGVGPATGGALIEIADWRWCFLVNLPIGVVAWKLSGRTLVESRAPGRRSVPDLGGAAVLALAIGTLTLGIVKGGDWGWLSPEVLGSWAVSALLTIWFVERCRHHRSPIVDLALLRVRSFSVANLLTVAAGAGFFGYILCNVLFLTVVWGYDALQAGLALTPGPFVAAAIAGPLGRLAGKVDPRFIVLPGGLVWALGLVYMITMVGPEPAFVSEWLPGMVILGIGAGATLPTLGSAAAAAAPGGVHATATALNSVARQLGAVLGVAILVAIIGDPSPAEVLGAFDAGWTFAAACLGVAALGALVLGRVSAEEPATLDIGSMPPGDRAALELAGLTPPTGAGALLRAESPPGSEEPLTTFLGRVRIFRGLPLEQLEQLADGAHDTYIRGGETLFERGDAAASMYVVRSGRLEVILDGEVIRVLGTGDIVGELALLADAPRSATVRARRDSLLVELSRDHFNGLVEQTPSFAHALVRTLGLQLQASKGLTADRPPLANILAVVALTPGVDPAALGEAVAAELRLAGSVAVLTGEGRAPGEYAHLVERVERDHDRVLLVAERDWRGDAWSEFCIRHADRVLAVVDDELPESWSGSPALDGCELVLAGAPGAATAGWLDRLAPRTTYRAPAGDAEAVALMGRRLTGTSVGVVLSGGGARGLAHIGALEELEAAGVKIDRLAGTSMGSFIGAMYASGMSIEEIDARCYEEWVRRRPLSDYRLPRTSIIRGQRVREMLYRTFSGPVEMTKLPFFCVSVDLLTAELVVHRRHSLGLAVGASMNLPGIAPPIAAHGRLLVDGGLRNNLPVDVMAADNEGPIVAVDVGGAATMELMTVEDAHGRGNDGARDPLRNAEEDSGVILPSLPELMTRIVTLSSIDGATLAEQYAQLVIRPRDEHVGLFEFHMLDELRASGRRAARAAMGGGTPAAVVAAAAERESALA